MALTAVVLLNQLVVVLATDNCTTTRYGLDADDPGMSCDDIYEKNPSRAGMSGYYLIKTGIQLVYCDMNSNLKDWIKVVDFNTSKQTTCPEGWATVKANDIRMCGPTSKSARQSFLLTILQVIMKSVV